ncbi:hypothetical protein [Nocardioides coralli]|uniref:hypothetical protein n=1 Tax=Nocardioides coralli TaxID=2872154 RepID=UPI001CA3CA66|nr:hypothetical protein [Nocardioides coralli]QZY28076.1 hypothetical protein K6T13_11295 [Nocardioides coralli]
MDDGDLTRVIDTASVGEVGWVDEAGAPRAAAVLPLLRDGTPVLALTFDRVELAVSLSGAARVDLLVREPRNTASGWTPTAWACRTRLVEDLDGDLYRDELQLQELRRYPPARRYADSPLLMREHWWFLPRLVVVLEPERTLSPPPARSDAADLLLVTADGAEPRCAGVRREPSGLTHSWGPRPTPGTGLVLAQEASFPDLESWTAWSLPVAVSEAGISAREPLPDVGPVGPPRLWERWRAERQLARACRRGLAAWQS